MGTVISLNHSRMKLIATKVVDAWEKESRAKAVHLVRQYVRPEEYEDIKHAVIGEFLYRGYSLPSASEEVIA